MWMPAIAGAFLMLGMITGAPGIMGKHLQSSTENTAVAATGTSKLAANEQSQKTMTTTGTAAAVTSIATQMQQDLNFVIPSAFAQIDNSTEAKLVANGTHITKITLVAKEENVTLPQGDVIKAMTFNSTIPAPTLRATQGDVIERTMINHPDNKQIHSIDHHAAIISAVPNFGPVKVGKSVTYRFIAEHAGFFKYHCEGNGVFTMDQHVFSGMAGGFIVDPLRGYPRMVNQFYDSQGQPHTDIMSPNAKEVVMVFSEWCNDKDGNYNMTAMNYHLPTYATINGIPFGYGPVVTKTKGAMPLHFKQGDHVRFFLLNVGDVPVNFHIVGEQLDRVIDGNKIAGVYKQTYLLGGSNDAIVDVVFNKPGAFVAVNHDYASLFKGQVAVIVVDGPDGKPGTNLGLKDYKDPSNAIPPAGMNSIPVDTTPYTLGKPLVWNGK